MKGSQDLQCQYTGIIMIDQPDASIVRIFMKDEAIPVGAGFLISEKHVLTCAHVVAQALDFSPSSSNMPTTNILLDFPRIDPKQGEASCVQWVAGISHTVKGVVAIDGKTLRRSHDQAASKKALHAGRVRGLPRSASFWLNWPPQRNPMR